MGYLLLVRHGESRWNTANKFTGWVDVPLSDNGVREAIVLSKGLRKLSFDVVFTSHLERAHETVLVILSDQHYTGIFVHEREHKGMRYAFKPREREIFVHTTWKLNERHYGLLQGMDKGMAAQEYGKDKVFFWRRSFTGRPPGGESLADVYKRVMPYFKKKILPKVKKNKNVLVVAHGNTLRAIIKHIDKISNKKIALLELKPGQPFIYKFEKGKLNKIFRSHSFNRTIAWK